MMYEHATSPDVKAAAEKGLVAILPLGSIEVHGPHMPTGTDALTICNLARMAAEREEAVVLPPVYFAYVPENRHFAGTISLTAKTLLSVLEEVCDEIARNGFKKILILNGHGGNNSIIRTFLRESLTRKRDYTLYAMIEPWAPIQKHVAELSEGRTVGHACELETSIGLYLFEKSIKMENVKHVAELGATNIPKGIETPVDWQAYALEAYLGEPRFATKEKGRILAERFVDYLTNALKTIKQDTNVVNVLDDFYRKAYEDGTKQPA